MCIYRSRLRLVLEVLYNLISMNPVFITQSNKKSFAQKESSFICASGFVHCALRPEAHESNCLTEGALTSRHQSVCINAHLALLCFSQK